MTQTSTATIPSNSRLDFPKERPFANLTDIEARVADSLRSYFLAADSHDPVGLGEKYKCVSGSVSALYQHYLNGTNWNDGWLDGVPYYRIAQQSDTTVCFAGLLVWGDDNGVFWLEPFHSTFQWTAENNVLAAYRLCFRTHDSRGRPIRFNNSEPWVSRHIWIPEASEPNDESDWVYVFRKPVEEPNVPDDAPPIIQAESNVIRQRHTG